MRDKFGNTLLHMAVNQCQPQMCKLLFDKKCVSDVNAKNNRGQSPLAAACTVSINCDPETLANMVQLLIDENADMNNDLFLGTTPLVYAILYKHVSVVKVLLENGFTNIYHRGLSPGRYNALDHATSDRVGNKRQELLDCICGYMVDQVDQFGGASKVLNFIQQSNAAQHVPELVQHLSSA